MITDSFKKTMEEALLEYIKNNPGVDSVDITSHFRLRADITLEVLGGLIEDGGIRGSQAMRVNQYYVTSGESRQNKKGMN